MLLLLTFILIVYMLRFHIWNKCMTIGLRLHQYLHTHNNFTEQNLMKFNRVTKISRRDFTKSKKINANRNNINEYTIADLSDNYLDVKRIINNKDRNESILRLLTETLKYVHLDGKSVSAEQCVLVDLIQSSGQYFPLIHTDVEWETFNKQDGFQIWYLFKNKSDVGNMFILDTPKVIPATHILFNDDRNIDIMSQDSQNILASYNIDDMNAKMMYLDMTEGECLIFGKNLYHTSDYRFPIKERIAINIRVLFRNPDGSIYVNPNSVGPYHQVTNLKIFKNSIRRGDDNKIYPGMFDLLELV